jgi:hypothetical protein
LIDPPTLPGVTSRVGFGAPGFSFHPKEMPVSTDSSQQASTGGAATSNTVADQPGQNSPLEAQSLASADPATPQTSDDMTVMHNPRRVDQPIRVAARLSLTNSAQTVPATTQVIVQELVLSTSAALSLEQAGLNRLFELWNTLLLAQADEIGDWSLDVDARLVSAKSMTVPAVLNVGATVYASGEVAFAVMLDGVDVPLWFTDVVDLSDLEVAGNLEAAS